MRARPEASVDEIGEGICGKVLESRFRRAKSSREARTPGIRAVAQIIWA
jgi:hypothetical protein